MLNLIKAITDPIELLKSPNLDKEVLNSNTAKRLKSIILNKIKNGLVGQVESKTKGNGLDFSNIRQYSVGDDVRYIDWNVFARTLTPHVREYMADKQQTLWFVIDISESMNFGKTKTKQQISLELMDIWVLVSKQIDARIGIIFFDKDQTHLVKASTKTKIPNSVDGIKKQNLQLDKLLYKTISSGDVVLLMSDFIEFPHFKCLRYIGKKAKVNTFLIKDSSEDNLPQKTGYLNLIDPETKEILQINTNDTKKIEEIKNIIISYQQEKIIQLKKIGKVFTINTDYSIMKILGGKNEI